MHPPLSEEQQRLVELVRTLGRDRFAARAHRYDSEASFPFENYADLREAGLLALTIPKRHGGLGADYTTYTLVSAELGRWCGATALTFNMHACSMLWSSQIADDLPMPAEDRALHERRRARIYERVVRDGAIFAQPFSEPDSAAAAGQAPFGTTARKVAGGWRVSGVKHFASLAGAAHYYGLLCTEDRPGMAPSVWSWSSSSCASCSRSTTSRATRCRSCAAAPCRPLRGRPSATTRRQRGALLPGELRWPHMFLTPARRIWHRPGASPHRRLPARRGPRLPGARARARPQPVGDMRLKLEQAKALFYLAVTEARLDPPKDSRLRAYAAQHTVMEHANDICRLAVRTCGGRSIMKSMPLERIYRDSRCGSLMLPWTAEICLERLGRESLFEPGERD
jgi:alkylation response protein AidB-like acyl-CoA dehydrogenase